MDAIFGAGHSPAIAKPFGFSAESEDRRHSKFGKRANPPQPRCEKILHQPVYPEMIGYCTGRCGLEFLPKCNQPTQLTSSRHPSNAYVSCRRLSPPAPQRQTSSDLPLRYYVGANRLATRYGFSTRHRPAESQYAPQYPGPFINEYVQPRHARDITVTGVSSVAIS